MLKMIITKTLKQCPKRDSYEVCIVVSVFKMANPYREFSKYTSKFDKWVNRIPKSAFVRMYLDDSVLDEPEVQKYFDEKYDKLEIIHFTAPDFLEEDGIHHDGTFGTITRMLPFYDDDLKAKYVWSNDLDLPAYTVSYNYIEDLKRTNSILSYWTGAFYERLWCGDNEFPINFGHLIINKDELKLNVNDFYQYLQDVLDGKYEEIKNKIYDVRKDRPRRKLVNPKYFIYGFDELFLNLYVNEIFLKCKRITYINMSLSQLKNYTPRYPEYEEVEHVNLLNYRKPEKKLFDKYMKLNDIIYNKILKDKVKNPNSVIFNQCMSIYKKYRKYSRFTKHFPLGAILTV